jgi:hypothetical protein
MKTDFLNKLSLTVTRTNLTVHYNKSGNVAKEIQPQPIQPIVEENHLNGDQITVLIGLSLGVICSFAYTWFKLKKKYGW